MLPPTRRAPPAAQVRIVHPGGWAAAQSPNFVVEEPPEAGFSPLPSAEAAAAAAAAGVASQARAPVSWSWWLPALSSVENVDLETDKRRFHKEM